MKSRDLAKKEVSTTALHRTEGLLMQTVLEAMLDSLTVEQQMKMAAYLLRRIKQRTKAADTQGDIHTTSVVFEA